MNKPVFRSQYLVSLDDRLPVSSVLVEGETVSDRLRTGATLIEGTLIVLAGGQGRRIGAEKALIDVCGEPLVSRAIRTLSPFFSSLIVVTSATLKLLLEDVRIVEDLMPDAGPLGGIYSGLSASRSEENFVVACDMPFLSGELAEKIVSLRQGADVAVPRSADGLEPLCAAYSRSCLPELERALGNGMRRITAFFDTVSVRIIESAELESVPNLDLAFFNINTGDDLALALETIKQSEQAVPE